jgi:HPt (histidine-containing phosphotransfer) domain-containing protein
MSSNRNNSYKLIILALSIFLLIVFFKSYKDNKSSKELQENLRQESVLTQNQLSEIIEKYDSVSMLYNNYDESFTALNSKINKIKSSKVSINFKSLAELNAQIETIKDSINLLQNKLKEIEKIKALVKPEEKKSKIVQNTIYPSSKFEITNLQVKGVKFLTENATPSKVKTIEQIRVCFTVDKNEAITEGEKELFVQVINPQNDIVSVEDLVYEKNNVVLKYSKLAKFLYKQQVTDVCSYVDLVKNKTFKGRYIINLYSGTTKISSTIFNYN